MRSIYKTRGTCSQYIITDVEDGILKEVEFKGGCDGNLTAMAILIKGQPVAQVIEKLEGIRCGMRSTSCADQLVQALRQAR